MTPRQHGQSIFKRIAVEGVAKYMRGQEEHGGRLWEIPIPTMIKFAQEEVIDQGSYVWTLDDQIELARQKLSQLFKNLKAYEEPIDSESAKLMAELEVMFGTEGV